jgi:hypothetical protein
VQSFSLNYLYPNYFSIVPTAISYANINFEFDYTSPLWAKLTVNFWASTVPQLQLGTFKVGTNHLI